MLGASALSTACLVGAAATAQETSTKPAIKLEDIVVYGAARDERELLDTPHAVTIVEGDMLERRQPFTYEALLSGQTGLAIQGGPRGVGQTPNIRGFEDEQIVLRVDGARQNFDFAHRGRFFLDPEILKQVEVIRGGASTMHGSGALGGVISLETKDAADVVAPGQVFGGALSGGYSSQGEAYRASATLGVMYDEFQALGFISYRPMGGFLIDGDGDDIADSDIDATQGVAKLAWTPNEAHRFEAGYSRYEDEGETAANASSAAASDNPLVDREVESRQATLSWTYAPVGGDLVDFSALAYWNETDLTENRISSPRLDESTLSTIGLELVNRSSFQLGAPVKLSYGVEIFQDDREATRDGAPRDGSPSATRNIYAVFAQADVALNAALTLTPGLRYDHFELKPDGALADRSDDAFSPRLALNWRPTENWQLYGSASQSFRAPSLTELYSDGDHFPIAFHPVFGFPTAYNTFVPNPDLEPEVARQLEVGGRYVQRGINQSGDSLNVSANIYVSKVENYIDQVVFASTTERLNVDAELWGFEAEAAYETPDYFLGLGLTMPRGRATSGGGLGSVPADKLVVTAGFRPLEGLTLGARGSFHDGQDDRVEPLPGAFEDPVTTPGYAVYDLFATYEPVEALTLRLGVDNVLDRAFRTHPVDLNQPGVAFKLGATARF